MGERPMNREQQLLKFLEVPEIKDAVSLFEDARLANRDLSTTSRGPYILFQPQYSKLDMVKKTLVLIRALWPNIQVQASGRIHPTQLMKSNFNFTNTEEQKRFNVLIKELHHFYHDGYMSMTLELILRNLNISII